MRITEVQIIPIKPKDGLVAIASIMANNSLYLGSVGVFTRLNVRIILLQENRRKEPKYLQLHK